MTNDIRVKALEAPRPAAIPGRLVSGILIAVFLYLFLLSINLLGTSFKLLGSDFAETMLEMTSNPLIGLFIGVIATSLIQSSSTTTSLVVGMVAGGVLDLSTAIPVVMGANIGTTVTNTFVSLAHIGHQEEFRRAFAASIVHDIFNVCAVLVLFPIEMKFGVLASSATYLQSSFAHIGGMELFNPLKAAVSPPVNLLTAATQAIPRHEILLILVSLILMFTALTNLIRLIRTLIITRAVNLINEYLFRNDFAGLSLGILITTLAQSSSITTSLIVPMAGTGIVRLKQIFPFTLGANVGTTITGILAGLATGNPAAVTVAFAHLIFNLLGIAIFYPLRVIPISLAEYLSNVVSVSPRRVPVFMCCYVMAYAGPAVLFFA